MFYTPEQKGLSAEQVNAICEELWAEELARPDRKCHDCAASPGERHMEGCDVARCTSCGGQRLACDCEDGEPDIWDGMWPGTRECYENKWICWEAPYDLKRFGIDASKINPWMFDYNKWVIERNKKTT